MEYKDHIEKAEDLLEAALNVKNDAASHKGLIGTAQVHATLALAIAQRETTVILAVAHDVELP